jgi:hypothetical protein
MEGRGVSKVTVPFNDSVAHGGYLRLWQHRPRSSRVHIRPKLSNLELGNCNTLHLTSTTSKVMACPQNFIWLPGAYNQQHFGLEVQKERSTHSLTNSCHLMKHFEFGAWF